MTDEPPVIGYSLPEPVSREEARQLAADHPEATVVLLPSPESLSTDDPAELAALLHECTHSLQNAIGRAIALDRLQGDWLPDGEARAMQHTAGYLEEAVLEVYAQYPEVIARLFITHLLDDAVRVEKAMDRMQEGTR